MPLANSLSPYRARLFRATDAGEKAEVSKIELFFDLVFVFGVTQLANIFAADLTPEGLIETVVLFLAIWWVWIRTCWATNWLDTERGAVRILLMVLMVGGLAIAVSLDEAFDDRGLAFALTYLAMHFGRTLAVIGFAAGVKPDQAQKGLRVGLWFLASAPFWIGGALLDSSARIALWGIALLIDYAGPVLGYRMPFFERARPGEWEISGEHMAERCALFIIIALGEGILVTGSTFANEGQTRVDTLAFLVAVAGSAILWWIYFDRGEKQGGEALNEADDTGRLARNAYTYAHIPIVLGLIVIAVADKKMIDAPNEPVKLAFVLVTCGGPLLFLIGSQLFKYLTAHRRWPPLSHFIGQGLLILVGVAALYFGWTYLETGAAALFALLVTAAWERLSLGGTFKRLRGEASLREDIPIDEVAG